VRWGQRTFGYWGYRVVFNPNVFSADGSYVPQGVADIYLHRECKNALFRDISCPEREPLCAMLQPAAAHLRVQRASQVRRFDLRIANLPEPWKRGDDGFLRTARPCLYSCNYWAERSPCSLTYLTSPSRRVSGSNPHYSLRGNLGYAAALASQNIPTQVKVCFESAAWQEDFKS